MANIMIVDDSILMRRNLRLLLQQAGHTIVAEASDGMEAYQEYARVKPDLVTMDITMPIMSGIDAVKKIIATYPDAVIIMISALDQRSMIFEAIQNGAKHYILKPITVEKILSVINEVLAPGEALPEMPSVTTATTSAPDGPAFGIDNKNGIFVIGLEPHLDESAMQQIEQTLQGFYFVKPLKVVFHFGAIESLADAHIQRIIAFMKQIQDHGGSAKAVSSQRGFITKLKADEPEFLEGKIFTNLEQVII